MWIKEGVCCLLDWKEKEARENERWYQKEKWWGNDGGEEKSHVR